MSKLPSSDRVLERPVVKGRVADRAISGARLVGLTAALLLLPGCEEEVEPAQVGQELSTGASAPAKDYAKAKVQLGTGKALATLDIGAKKVVVSTSNGDVPREITGDIDPISITIGNVAGDAEDDLVVFGKSTIDDVWLVQIYKGTGAGQFEDKMGSDIQIANFNPSTGALALSNVVKGAAETTDDRQDLVLAGRTEIWGNQSPGLLVLPGSDDGFEKDPDEWFFQPTAIDVDDVLPGEIDASMFAISTNNVNEATSGDLFVRFSGMKQWTLLLRTDDRALLAVP